MAISGVSFFLSSASGGFFISAVISAIAVFVISNSYMHSWKPGFAVAFGLILASIIQVLTQHFTDVGGHPRHVARRRDVGHGVSSFQKGVTPGASTPSQTWQ